MESQKNFEKPRDENILERLKRVKSWARDWFVGFSRKKNAERWLAFFSFAEASFFPLPPDLLLIALLIVDGARWIYRAFLTTIFSVLGGIAGYFIGIFFFDFIGEPIISLYHLEDEVIHVDTLLSHAAFLAIFAAALTPIPYKVFTIAAGFFSVNIYIFIIASFLGRGLRFFPVAYLAKRYGPAFRPILYKHFNLLTLAFVVVLLVLFMVAQ